MNPCEPFRVSHRRSPNRLPDIEPDLRNLFLLWEGQFPKPSTLAQIQSCLQSIAVHEPDAKVYLFSSVLQETDLSNANATLVRYDHNLLLHGTPLDGRLPDLPNDWRLWSDVFRVVCLWRWGGTYFDLDDIMVRPLPDTKNTMAACFLTPYSYRQWFPASVIPGEYSRHRGKLAPAVFFRIGADPMVNFEPGNHFLHHWIMRFRQSGPVHWGQTDPSAIFAQDPAWARRYVTPVNWSDLLYQPYDGGHHPDDQRYFGPRILTEQLLTEADYSLARETIFGSYSFFLVKNHDFKCHCQSGPNQPFLHWLVQDLQRRLERGPI